MTPTVSVAETVEAVVDPDSTLNVLGLKETDGAIVSGDEPPSHADRAIRLNDKMSISLKSIDTHPSKDNV